jgi:oxygen-independent coproporphyrinogen-3 oxidase
VIYIHIPFCRSFCTYCDFYSEVASRCRKAEEARRQEALFESYARAVSAEALFRAEEICDDVDTLYLGGGTPSVLPLSALQRIVDGINSIRGTQPYREFTIEVNPEDIVEKGHAYVEGLLRMGVNRVSMGVQSFDDDVLKFMNRRHDSAMARKAYHILEEAGVENISIDLIFGLPQLSDSAWQSTLDKALEISSGGHKPCHISSYQLSVEPGSTLASLVERGQWTEASEGLCERQYGMLCRTLADAGYHHYEISNFALPGYEAVHNSAYWNHSPYVGLGPGAHSFIFSPADPASTRRWNLSDVNAYIDAAESGDFPSISESEILTGDQLTLERIMLGLRTSRGIDAEYLRAHVSCQDLEHAIVSGNLIMTSEGLIRIPEDRFFISDTIIADIV